VRVFVTGGTGLIGRALVTALARRGDHAIVLSRREAAARADLAELGAGVEVVGGDPTAAGPWQASVAGCDAVVNLAGEPVGQERWDAGVRQRLRDSRIDATRFVVEAIAAAPPARRPRVLASASGSDYYPSAEELAALGRGVDDPVDESTPPGASFLARLCQDWEAEARAAEAHGVRVATMRTGLVIAEDGAMARLSTPFKLFVGGRLGSGRQWTSWIHLDDVVAASLRVVDDAALSGPVNLASPVNATNAELAAAVGHRLGRPSWLPVPAFAIKAAVGDFAEYVLHGRRVVPGALSKVGFEFRYPDLASALAATRL
jgi:uncharacterized protein (TIGR01777 family)